LIYVDADGDGLVTVPARPETQQGDASAP